MSTDFAPHNMTSDSAPSPYVAAGSAEFGAFLAYKAFDGGTGIGQYALCTGGGVCWFSLDIGSGNAYILLTYDVQVNTIPEASRAPKDWTMEGSNDNSSWTTVDTVTSQTSWGSGETRSFTCDTQTTAYRYFRLNVTANNGDGTFTQLAELFLYTDIPINLSPAAGALAYTPATPTLDWSGTITLAPAAGALSISSWTPTITLTTNITLSPAAASLAITPATPTLAFAINLAPATASQMRYTPQTPTVSVVTTTATGRVAIIGGVTYLWDDTSPATITKTLSNPWSATISIFHVAGGVIPQPGDEVALFWDSIKRFGGFVLSTAESAIQGDTALSSLQITCTGNQGYCDRAIVAKLYTLSLGGVGAVMIYGIWQDHLSQFGITIDYPQGPIAAIAEQLFWYITVTEAFNRIRDQFPGWDWYISDNKQLVWVQNGLGPAAPFTLRNGDTNQDSVTVTVSGGKFRNKQWVLPSTTVQSTRTESAVSISGQTVFPTEYALTVKPIVTVDTGGGPVNQAVDTLGLPFTGAPCYYVPNGIGVFFFSAPGGTVAINYPSPWPLGFSSQNDASIAAVGLYESVYQAKNVTDEATAVSLAAGLLALYGTAGAFQKQLDFTYNSNSQSAWLVPGNVLDVNRTFPTANDFFTVEQINSQLDSLKIWRHSVTARKDPGDVAATFEQDFLSGGRLWTGNAPAPSTWQVGMDIQGLTNPGIAVGLLKDVWRCPPIPGGGGIVIASWDGWFPVLADVPTGANFIADFLLNGTSIFPAGSANKMVITAGSNLITTGFKFTSQNILVVEGDYVQMNIIQVGSSNPGSNALFHLNFVR